MRVVLVADTSAMPNVGSQATTDGLLAILSERGARSVYSIPFARVLEVGRTLTAAMGVVSRARSRARRLVLAGATARSVEPGRRAFERAVRVLREDAAILREVEAADTIVINGEGILHHDNVSGWALLALAEVGLGAGRPVVLANATVEAIRSRLAWSILRRLRGAWAREPLSGDYLRTRGVATVTAGDCAALARYDELPPRAGGGGALVTAGVAASPAAVRSVVSGVRAMGWDATYLRVDGADDALTALLDELAVPSVDASAISWRGVPSALRSYDLVVSGRHHVAIFAMLAGVPVVPLESNSWKVRGTLLGVGLRHAPLSARTPPPPAALARAVDAATAAPREALPGRLREAAARHFEPSLASACVLADST